MAHLLHLAVILEGTICFKLFDQRLQHKYVVFVH